MKNLNVAIDVTPIQYGRGASRYASNLIRALLKENQIDLSAYAFSIRGKSRLLSELKAIGIDAHVFPIPIRLMQEIWNTLHLMPLSWLTKKPDLVHSWELQPPDRNLPIVHTVHDLAMWKYPNTADPFVYDMVSKSYQYLVKHELARFIAVSNQTKQDFIEYFQVDPDRIEVIYSAQPVEQKLVIPASTVKEVQQKHNLTKPYLLFVGTAEPRKNLQRMITAWRTYKKEYDFVLIGGAGWEVIKKEDGLHQLGYLDGEQLGALMKGAETLMFASIYEGFGFPILDAFFHGIPVVTSDSSAMAEIGSSAVVLVDPFEEASISQGIETALKNRSRLIKKGRIRLKHFSWKKTAQQTTEVYRRAVE